MKQERVILSFIMVMVGLVAAGIIFYFYQSTKVVTPAKETAKAIPTQNPQSNSFFLTVDKPQDESISENKTVEISGRTDKTATVVILTKSDQQVLQPSTQGGFSTTVTIENGVNYFKIMAILPDGESKTVQKVVSYTTQNF